MADWIDFLTRTEAKAILDTPEPRNRFKARDARGSRVTRFVAPTALELERIKAVARGE